MPKASKSKTTAAAPQPAGVTTGTETASVVQAQSEIGPISYRDGQAPHPHGPDDEETKAAYAAGRPTQGLAYAQAQRESAPAAKPE